MQDGSPNIMSRIYTYPRGLYRGYTAYIVLRLPCCCSGHNIIPTTHQRNEPFIAALLGCCFLSQANTTSSSSSSSLNRRPRSWRSRLLPFRASLFLLLAAHRAHTHTYYPRCVTLRYVAYIRAMSVHASRRCTCARSCVRFASRVTKIPWESHSLSLIIAATFLKDDHSHGRR